MAYDRRTKLVIVGAAVVISSFAAPSNARAQGTTVDQTVPIVDSIFNVCKAEFVTFTGTLRVLVHESESADGSMTLKKQTKIEGSGSGAVTAHQYRVFQIDDSESTGPKPTAGMQYEQTDTNNTDVNGPVQDDHFIFQFKTHMTVKPGGIVTVSFTDFKSCCPGSDGTLSCQPIMFRFP